MSFRTTIEAVVIAGTGSGPTNLPLQIPLIQAEFPEIATKNNTSSHFLTLELDRPLIVMTSDHRTEPVQWDPNDPGAEVFDFVRVKITFDSDKDETSMLLYVAHWSDFRRNPFQHELICPVADIAVGTRCHLVIERQCVSLEYKIWDAVVIV